MIIDEDDDIIVDDGSQDDFVESAIIYKEAKDLSTFQLERDIKRGSIILRPDFQRNFVWNKNKQTKFIDTLMLGLPVPHIFMYTDKENKKLVVDGSSD